MALVTALSVGSATAGDRTLGIDVSHHNNIESWATLQGSEVRFVILKATDGVDYLDASFADRFSSLANTDLIRGAYHFYETNDDPVQQADWFICNAPLGPGDLPPIVDIESVKGPIPGHLRTNFKIFLSRLESHYGAKPIIYTGPRFWNHTMKEHLPSYPLWIAQYEVDEPFVPAGWQAWTLWQHTDSYSVPGLVEEMDASYFNGSTVAMKRLTLDAHHSLSGKRDDPKGASGAPCQ